MVVKKNVMVFCASLVGGWMDGAKANLGIAYSNKNIKSRLIILNSLVFKSFSMYIFAIEKLLQFRNPVEANFCVFGLLTYEV